MLTRPDPSRWWKVTREWEGETAFVICGGPSVLSQDTEALRGRKVVAINSSYQRAPFADILFFGDLRWWNVHRSQLAEFPGRIVTSRKASWGSIKSAPIPLELDRLSPPGLATRPTALAHRRTAAAGVINMLAHLGVSEIVTLGLDGKPDDEWLRTNGKNGRCHHHEKHKWPVIERNFAAQIAELRGLVKPLADLGISLRNASPGSAIPFWPIVPLEQCL